MDDIEAKIFDIVAKERRLDRSTLSRDTKLEDIEIESVEFDVDVPQEEDAFKLETMGDIVDGVRKLIEAKQAETAASGE